MKKLKTICLSLILLLTANTTSVFAAEPAAPLPELTVADATSYAIANNGDLKEINESKVINDDDAKVLKDKIWDATDEATSLKLAVQMMQSDIKTSTYSENEQIQREIIENSISNFFSTIVNAEKDLALYDKNIELTLQELNITKKKNSLGLTSDADLQAAKNGYNKMLNDRKTKEIALDKAYISLNEIMGKDLKNKYSLVLELTYKPLGDVEIQPYISNAIAQNPTVKSLRGEAKIADYQLASYSSQNTDSSKETFEISVTQAYRKLTAQEDKIRENVTTLYNDILDLETQYTSNKLVLADMKEKLAIKEKELEVGKLTPLEVEKYRLDIIQLEETMRKQVSNHALKIQTFKNPNLL